MSVFDRSKSYAFLRPWRCWLFALTLSTGCAWSAAGSVSSIPAVSPNADGSSEPSAPRWHLESALLSPGQEAASHAFGLPLARGAADLLTERLDQVLRQAGSEESVPVLIYLRDRGASAPERDRIRALPRALRKEEGARILRREAERSQAPIRGFLEGLVDVGEASNVRSLWLVNAVAVHLPAARIYDLLRFPEIRKVDWDPILDTQDVFDDEPKGSAPSLDEATPSLDESGASRDESAARGVDSSASERTLSQNRDDGLDPTVFTELYRIRAPDCWSAGYDGSGVLIAFLDAGFDYTHPDVASRLYTNPGEIEGNGTDDDNNGFIDDVHGWDFINGDNEPLVVSGNEHGTNVLGLAVGDGTNGFLTGAAKGAEFLPIASVGSSFSASVWFAGFDYAALMGADVVVMSATQKWSPSSKPDFDAWREIMENVLVLGIVHANSAGNRGLLSYESPFPFNVGAPATCPSPWQNPYDYSVGGRTSVVTVGALRETDEIRDASSRGPVAWEDFAANWPAYPDTVRLAYQDYPWSPEGSEGLLKPDLCAPGTELKTLDFGGGYVDRSGTSFSTPYVGGAMAILLQARPDLTPQQIDQALQMTAVDLGAPGKDNVYGAGMLDCYAALQYALSLDNLSDLDLVVRSSASLDTLPGANVTLLAPSREFRTNETGRLELPVTSGLLSVIIDHYGFRPDTLLFNIPMGSTFEYTAELDTLSTGSIVGVVRGPDQAPIENATVRILGTPFSSTTDAAGAYQFGDVPGGDLLSLEAFCFNYAISTDTLTVIPGFTDSLDFELAFGLFDDFERDQGWIVGDLGDQAYRGIWERSDPNGTYDDAVPVQPEDDYSAVGSLCFHTENSHSGAGPLVSEVGRGRTTLLSPIFDGTVYDAPYLSYARWLSNDTDGNTSNDANSLRTLVSSNGGETWTEIDAPGQSSGQWNEVSFELGAFVTLTDSMQIRFAAYDITTSGVVEAAIDDVRIAEDTSDISDADVTSTGPRFVLSLQPGSPNPFRDATTLRFQVPATEDVRLDVFDVQGRRVRELVSGSIDAGSHTVTWDGRDDRGNALASGLYFYRLSQSGAFVTGRALRMR